MSELIPILGVLSGIIIPIAVFIWLYLALKEKNKTILEIAKQLDDPSRAEEFLHILDERKKEPIVGTLNKNIAMYWLGQRSQIQSCEMPCS